jgi:hypothetical protein
MAPAGAVNYFATNGSSTGTLGSLPHRADGGALTTALRSSSLLR